MRNENTRQVISPVQDVEGVCVELTAMAQELTQEQWDRVRRLVATLHGVAEMIGGLVLPEAKETGDASV